jgi:hypothetical protein
MKKFIWSSVAIVVIYLIGLQMAKNESPAPAMDVSTRAPMTLTPEPTRTPVPTATIGYMETALVAQATADEARRINAQATAAHESVLLAQSQLTAQAEANALVQLQLTAQWEGITATAAYTSVPLTATQQYHNNTALAAQQSLQAAQLTATKGAPTQIMAMAQAENYAKYGGVDYFARWFFIVVIVAFLIGLLAWFIRNPVLPRTTTEEQPKNFTINYVKRENGGYKQSNFNVPCSPEQLSELAEMAVNDEKRFAINRLEQTSRTFKSQRDALERVRDWLCQNEMAVKDEHNHFMLNDDGAGFLLDWFEDHKLREGYEFTEGEQEHTAEEAEVVDETS